MAEITFGVGYMNQGPDASPLYSDKMKTWIVATIPREMFNSAQRDFRGIFNDIMTNLGYGRHSPTLFSKGAGDDSSKAVVEFDVNEGAGKINIMLYNPNQNVDPETETYIKNQLKQRIESVYYPRRPGGRRHKTRKHRSRRHKKTRKH